MNRSASVSHQDDSTTSRLISESENCPKRSESKSDSAQHQQAQAQSQHAQNMSNKDSNNSLPASTTSVAPVTQHHQLRSQPPLASNLDQRLSPLLHQHNNNAQSADASHDCDVDSMHTNESSPTSLQALASHYADNDDADNDMFSDQPVQPLILENNNKHKLNLNMHKT
jgi:hypothetical protein